MFLFVMADKKHILVVEDDVDLNNSILTALTASGYIAHGAVDTRDAGFKLKNQTYACILVDIKLGIESGESLILQIRERRDYMNLDSPIVVISGNLDRPLVEKIGRKIQGALVKPFSMPGLLDTVSKHAN